MVGSDMIRSLAPVTGFSSTLSLTMAILSWVPAISSSTGEIILHGPHHSAQKSTRTGFSDISTSSVNVASVTILTAPMRRSFQAYGGLSVAGPPYVVGPTVIDSPVRNLGAAGGR